MNMKNTYAALAAAILCTCAGLPLMGQEASATPSLDPGEGRPSGGASRIPGELNVVIGRGSNVPVRPDMRQLIKKYQAADDEQGKQNAKQELSSALSNYFDNDMKLREQEILDIEARVKKLKEQLEKRREAKAKIVDLQLQVLVNEAEGLGFYGPPSSRLDFSDYPARPTARRRFWQSTEAEPTVEVPATQEQSKR